MSLEEIIQAARQLPRRDKQRLIEELRRDEQSISTGDGAPTEPSAYEKSKHLAGSIEGPHDLGSNPAHMEGFGRDSLS